MSHNFVRGQSVAETCFSHWGYPYVPGMTNSFATRCHPGNPYAAGTVYYRFQASFNLNKMPLKLINHIDSKGIPPALVRGNTLTIYMVSSKFQSE